MPKTVFPITVSDTRFIRQDTATVSVSNSSLREPSDSASAASSDSACRCLLIQPQTEAVCFCAGSRCRGSSQSVFLSPRGIFNPDYQECFHDIISVRSNEAEIRLNGAGGIRVRNEADLGSGWNSEAKVRLKSGKCGNFLESCLTKWKRMVYLCPNSP